MAATFFGNRTPPSERILRMGAAVTHAAAASSDEIDDGNIFGCAAAENGVIKRRRQGACRNVAGMRASFSAIDVKSGLLTILKQISGSRVSVA